MLAPIRPSPTTPISILPPFFSTQRLVYGVPQGAQSRFDVSAQLHANDSPAALAQNRKVSASLRLQDRREIVIAAGHWNVRRRFMRDLDKDAAIRATLVKLPRRVQEPRAIADGGRDMPGIADRRANLLQKFVLALVARYEGVECAVVMLMQAREMSFKRARKPASVARLLQN